MSIDKDGFELVPGALTAAEIDALSDAVAGKAVAHAQRKQSTFGGRNLLDVQEIATLANRLKAIVAQHVPNPRPVRALFFDKTPDANWPVLWHQDLTIAVDRRIEKTGWGPWSTKAGVVHVEPPVQILERMLAVRLHIDESDTNNGPLRVLPGTHRLGRLRRERIADLRNEVQEVACTAPIGAALLMRPLLLHASSPAQTPSHRRVVQIEYAPADALPEPLEWAFAA